MTKLVKIVTVIVLLAGAMTVVSAPAQARWGHRHGWHHGWRHGGWRGFGWGFGIGFGAPFAYYPPLLLQALLCAALPLGARARLAPRLLALAERPPLLVTTFVLPPVRQSLRIPRMRE